MDMETPAATAGASVAAEVPVAATEEDIGKESSKIVVEKLTKNVTEAHLREIFGSYGRIESIDLPLNRQFMTNRGTAYILYDHPSGSEAAIAHMHEAQLDGAVISPNPRDKAHPHDMVRRQEVRLRPGTAVHRLEEVVLGVADEVMTTHTSLVRNIRDHLPRRAEGRGPSHTPGRLLEHLRGGEEVQVEVPHAEDDEAQAILLEAATAAVAPAVSAEA
ncbi:hypothetical protein ABEF95_012167 [Exophiala dermatitidis]